MEGLSLWINNTCKHGSPDSPDQGDDRDLVSALWQMAAEWSDPTAQDKFVSLVDSQATWLGFVAHPEWHSQMQDPADQQGRSHQTQLQLCKRLHPDRDDSDAKKNLQSGAVEEVPKDE